MNCGGPVMLTFGWIVGSAFTLLVALNLAEICSTYPVSGSVYAWAGLLAKKEHSAMTSFVCGWFSFLGNAACDASFAYGFAQMLSAIIQLGTYDPDNEENTVSLTN
jgi:amino acid transporter